MATKANRKSQKVSKAQAQKRQDRELADQEARERKKARQTMAYKVAAVIFAALMALGIALPSLSSIVGRNGAENSISSIEDVDNMYSGLASQYEDAVAKNPNDAAAVLNLGGAYSSWAQMGSFFVAGDETKQGHVNELYAKAIAAYDAFLESNESADVVVARAQARALSGDPATAATELEQLTSTVTDNAQAWLLLGSIYQTNGDNEKARATYEKAAAADPDDAAGVKTTAEERINAIDNPSTGTDADAAASGETGPEALSNALNDAAGTSVESSGTDSN